MGSINGRDRRATAADSEPTEPEAVAIAANDEAAPGVETIVDVQSTERHSAPQLEARANRPLPQAPSDQRLPWILVGTLGVAVAALVAYMVIW